MRQSTYYEGWTTRGGRQLRILILSASYGAGHNQVARSVNAALTRVDPSTAAETRDYFEEFVNPLMNRATQAIYLWSISHAPGAYGMFYRLTGDIRPDSPFQRWLNSLGAKRLLRVLQRKQPDAIVCTFPTPAGVLSRLRASGRSVPPVFTIVTDHTVHSQWIHPHTDQYFVSSPEVAEGIAERGIPQGRIAVTGIPIRRSFQEAPSTAEARNQLGLHPDRPTVLVMAGAFASLGGAPRVVQTLSDCPHALQAVVIAGRDEELVEQLKTQVAGSKNPIHVYGFREDIPTFMAAADVLVTKAGGITTTEALAMHLPLIIYQPISGQEEANTRYLVENGAGIQANNLEELELALRELVSDPSRQRRMAGCAAKLGRPDAAELIAETVCKACLETQEVKTS